MGFARFMSSTIGRLLRIVAGIVVILLGIFVARATVWTIVLIVLGLVPLLAGLVNVCVFAPLFGGPFSGKKALQGGEADA